VRAYVNVVLFGATGMVGGGVLRECLEDERIERVLSVSRKPSGLSHAKLEELIHADLGDLAGVRTRLAGYDACFYCLGISSAGLDETTYRRISYDFPVAAASALLEQNPALVFCFVSGAGTDSSGAGRVMWARVKGEAENRLLGMSPHAYMFRPGFIQPMKGVRSSTASYRVFYALAGPLFPLLRRAFPRHVTTTVAVGRAMIRVATERPVERVLETEDINAWGAR